MIELFKKNIDILTNLSLKKRIYMIIAFVLFLIFYAIVIGFVGENAWGFYEYVCFLLFYVVIPGYCIVSFFDLPFSRFVKLLYAYVTGYIFLIILYCFTINYPFGKIFIRFFPLLLSLVFLVVYTLKNKNLNLLKQFISNKAIPFLLIISGMFIFLQLIVMLLGNPTLSKIGITTYNQDFLVHIGNIGALEYHFPPFDLRFSGSIYKYHYFDAIFHAVAKISLNLNGFSQVYYFQEVFNLILLICVLYFFGKFLLKSHQFACLFVLLYMFCGDASGPWAFKNGFGEYLNINLFHILTNVNSSAIERSFILLSFIMLMSILETPKIQIKHYFLLFLMIMTTAGIKGPAAILLILCMIVVSAISVLKKQIRTDFIIFVILTSIGFFALYKIVLSGGEGTLNFNSIYTIMNTRIGHSLKHLTENKYILYVLCYIFTPIHFILYAPTLNIPFIQNLLTKIKKIKYLSIEDYLVFSMAIGGFFLTYLLEHPGFSELYFAMTALPFVSIIGIRQLRDGLRFNRKFYNFIIILCISTTLSSFLYFGKIGYKNFKSITKYQKTGVICTPGDNQISIYEYKGLLYLRNNTPTDTIFATSRLFLDKYEKDSKWGGRSLYYTTFSGRRAFIEGYQMSLISGTNPELIKKRLRINNYLFARNNIDKKYSLLKSNKISYVIITKYLTPDWKVLFENDSYFQNVFKNRDVLIYKVL